MRSNPIKYQLKTPAFERGFLVSVERLKLNAQLKHNRPIVKTIVAEMLFHIAAQSLQAYSYGFDSNKKICRTNF